MVGPSAPHVLPTHHTCIWLGPAILTRLILILS